MTEPRSRMRQEGREGAWIFCPIKGGAKNQNVEIASLR